MKYVGLRRKKYKFVYPSLACTTCCHLGSNFVPVGDAEYLNDCRTTKRWFDFDFISGFAALVSHEAHLKNDSQSHSPVHLVHCPYPQEVPSEGSCRHLPEGTERVVSVLYLNSHFAVSVIDVKEKQVLIYDGLRHPICDWNLHVLTVLNPFLTYEVPIYSAMVANFRQHPPTALDARADKIGHSRS